MLKYNNGALFLQWLTAVVGNEFPWFPGAITKPAVSRFGTARQHNEQNNRFVIEFAVDWASWYAGTLTGDVTHSIEQLSKTLQAVVVHQSTNRAEAMETGKATVKLVVSNIKRYKNPPDPKLSKKG